MPEFVYNQMRGGLETSQKCQHDNLLEPDYNMKSDITETKIAIECET